MHALITFDGKGYALIITYIRVIYLFVSLKNIKHLFITERLFLITLVISSLHVAHDLSLLKIS